MRGRGLVLVFPHIIPHPIRTLRIARGTHKPRPGHILKIPAERDALCVKQVDYGGDVLGDVHGVVVVESEILAPNGGEVVGLRRVRVRVVFGEQDALPLEVGDVWVEDYFGVVLLV